MIGSTLGIFNAGASSCEVGVVSGSEVGGILDIIGTSDGGLIGVSSCEVGGFLTIGCKVTSWVAGGILVDIGRKFGCDVDSGKFVGGMRDMIGCKLVLNKEGGDVSGKLVGGILAEVGS